MAGTARIIPAIPRIFPPITNAMMAANALILTFDPVIRGRDKITFQELNYGKHNDYAYSIPERIFCDKRHDQWKKCSDDNADIGNDGKHARKDSKENSMIDPQCQQPDAVQAGDDQGYQSQTGNVSLNDTFHILLPDKFIVAWNQAQEEIFKLVPIN